MQSPRPCITLANPYTSILRQCFDNLHYLKPALMTPLSTRLLHRPSQEASASDKEAETPLEATSAKLFDLGRNIDLKLLATGDKPVNCYLPRLHLGGGLEADNPIHVLSFAARPGLDLDTAVLHNNGWPALTFAGLCGLGLALGLALCLGLGLGLGIGRCLLTTGCRSF